MNMNRVIFSVWFLLLGGLPLLAQQPEVDVAKTTGEIVNLLTTKYYRTVTPQELVQGLIHGLPEVLDDQYIQYYSPKEYELLKQELVAKYQGIGAIIKYEEREEAIATKPYDLEAIRAGKIETKDVQRTKIRLLKIISPLPGSPAERAGAKADDIIEAIDESDEHVAKYTLPDVIKRLRGPQGSKLKLRVYRTATQERLNLDIVREEFSIQGFSCKLLTEEIAYLSCKFFHKNFAIELRKALESFQQDQIKGLILDLRDCSGGVLDEAVATANLFLEPGPVLQYRGRDQRIVRNLENPIYFSKPMVVLIGKDTSSGAELLAGAFKDRGRAILVGQKTYGKGSIQEIFELTNAGAIKLTVAHYLTPNGHTVDKQGVAPDVEVADEKEQIAIATSLIKVLATKTK